LNFLSQNPEVQEKIYQESIRMNDTLTYEDLNQAHYTRAAVHESFRLSPTAFAVARILEQDCNLSGYNVKAGVRT
jgi:cytochrome P450